MPETNFRQRARTFERHNRNRRGSQANANPHPVRCFGRCSTPQFLEPTTRTEPMRKWTKAAGILFLAASAVYSDPVSLADEGSKESKAAPHPATPDVFAKHVPTTPSTVTTDSKPAVAHPTTAPSVAAEPAPEADP